LWNFGDGDTSSAVDPSHNFTQDGIYNIQLTATNDVGCVSTASDSLKVVPASLDLEILYTNVTHDTTGRYNLCAFIINVGTRTVYNFDIVASLGGGSTIIEHVSDTLNTGDTLYYCFNSHYFTTVPDNQTYVCINTENPDSATDQNPANNVICTALQDNIRFILPFPNPAYNQVTFGMVLPANEPLVITLYNELGQKLGVVFNGTGQEGLNQWTVNTAGLPQGNYYFQVQYMQDYYTIKFIVQ
jgi:PKD repeat protein